MADSEKLSKIQGDIDHARDLVEAAFRAADSFDQGESLRAVLNHALDSLKSACYELYLFRDPEGTRREMNRAQPVKIASDG
jgi:hypothetical protein